MKRKKIYAGVMLLFTFLYFLRLFILFLPEKSSIYQYISSKAEIEKEFKSESSFGGDYFQIESFHFEKPQKIKGFKNIDEQGEQYIQEAIHWIHKEENNKEKRKFNHKKILQDIYHIQESRDGQYLHVEEKKKGKLQTCIYSKSLDIGYCFTLKI